MRSYSEIEHEFERLAKQLDSLEDRDGWGKAVIEANLTGKIDTLRWVIKSRDAWSNHLTLNKETILFYMNKSRLDRYVRHFGYKLIDRNKKIREGI